MTTIETINLTMLSICLILSAGTIFFLRKMMKEDNQKIVAETKRQIKEHTEISELKSDEAFREFMKNNESLTEWFKTMRDLQAELNKAMRAKDSQMIQYFQGMINKHKLKKPKSA